MPTLTNGVFRPVWGITPFVTEQVCVFAPSPQLTVTVEDLDGRPDVHLHAGGQGFWQARMITALGSPVTLCCALGGETGEVLRHLLAAADIAVLARDVAARNGAYVHDRRDGDRQPVVEMGPDSLTRHEMDDLYELTVVAGMAAGVVVLSGSVDDATEEVVPVSVYERLCADLVRNRSRVVVDLAGARLDAALAGVPTVVKVSHEELLADGRAKSDTVKGLAKAARTIVDAGVELVVVSRAEEPTLAVHGDTGLLVSAPSLAPVDTRGGGDSMTAGIAAALAQGEDVEAALRLGGAAGALNVTRHGLGTGSGDAVRALAERVELTPAG
jgi:1-phosphofructokinase